MSKQDLWMPLYIADYLADTMHLTTEEHGAYLLIIIHYWRNGGAIKNDKKTLKIIAKISSKKLENVLRFFYEKDGYLHHKRIDEELAKAAENKEKQKKRTEAATLARQQRYVDVTSNVTFTPSPSPSPSSSLRSEEKNSEDKSSSLQKKSVLVSEKENYVRLPHENLPDDWRDWAMLERGWDEPTTEIVWLEFRDYWKGLKGQKAKKSDWLTTWKNRCLSKSIVARKSGATTAKSFEQQRLDELNRIWDEKEKAYASQ